MHTMMVTEKTADDIKLTIKVTSTNEPLRAPGGFRHDGGAASQAARSLPSGLTARIEPILRAGELHLVAPELGRVADEVLFPDQIGRRPTR